MNSAWACAAFVAGLLVVFIGTLWVYCGGKYRRIFSDEHYKEFAEKIVLVKKAALERIEDSDEEEQLADDPRVLLTSEGLVLAYTIDHEDGQFNHHFSVSHWGGYTAHAVGEAFILYTVNLLGVPLDKLEFSMGQSTVHHAGYSLSPDEQFAFASSPIKQFSPEVVKAIQDLRSNNREKLVWERIET